MIHWASVLGEADMFRERAGSLFGGSRTADNLTNEGKRLA